MKHNQDYHDLLSRQQIALNSKHLRGNTRGETIHLSRVLLHLPGVEQRLQPAGLLGQLEQPLPFVLRKQSLLGSSARSVLRLALLLPGSNLGLLTSEGSLVVLIVVDLRVVVLYALEEQVACLLEEGVDGEIK